MYLTESRDALYTSVSGLGDLGTGGSSLLNPQSDPQVITTIDPWAKYLIYGLAALATYWGWRLKKSGAKLMPTLGALGHQGRTTDLYGRRGAYIGHHNWLYNKGRPHRHDPRD